MGEVYRALDAKLGREVTIKVLPPEFARDPERLAGFEREARVLASLNHPNIAAIYGLEKSDGVPFLVLELVPSETLAGPASETISDSLVALLSRQPDWRALPESTPPRVRALLGRCDKDVKRRVLEASEPQITTKTQRTQSNPMLGILGALVSWW